MLGINVPKVLVRGEQAKAIRQAAARACKPDGKTTTKRARWTFKMKD